MKKVGFIGLGTMGRGMAFNILKAGFEMCVYDIDPKVVDKFVVAGAKGAQCPKEVAQWSEAVLTMLPDVPQVEEVYLGENGLIAGGHQGLYLIDCSTVDPDCSRRISRAAAGVGIVMFDAPVGGSPVEAANGNLVMLAGGDKKDIMACRKILDACGERTLFCGPIGSGSATKLANNLMTLIYHQMIVEGYNLAEMSGVNTTTLAELQSINIHKISELITLTVMAKEHKAGFNINLANKDLKYALKMANDVGAPTPLGAVVKSTLQMQINQGKGHLSAQSVQMLYENKETCSK
jgi:3-hydroxyisobutyrate dehydrogenase-like beta-hydroxyacid dehydrogenase